MNDSFFGEFSFLGGTSAILSLDFFIKSSVNNTPINRYHNPGGFGKASPRCCGDPPNAIDLYTGSISRKSDA